MCFSFVTIKLTNNSQLEHHGPKSTFRKDCIADREFFNFDRQKTKRLSTHDVRVMSPTSSEEQTCSADEIKQFHKSYVFDLLQYVYSNV